MACDCRIVSSLSLVGHSGDVGAVLHALVEQPGIRSRLASLLGRADLCDADRARLVALGCLHDLGKVNLGFQNREEPGRRPRAGHIGPLYSLLDRGHESVADALFGAGRLAAVQHMLFSGDSATPWVTILAHHGDLPVPEQPDPALWRAVAGYDPVVACRELVDAVLGWCPLALPADPLAWTPAFAHAFAGLLTLADWLGSDESVFPLKSVDGDGPDVPDGVDRYAWSLPRARAMLRRRGLAPEAARTAVSLVEPGAVLAHFTSPSPVQRAMLDLPPAGAGRICLLEGETGSGKTEAALAHFVDLFRQGAVDGFYFALPTRAAAKQIHGRIKAALQRLLGTDAVPHVTLAVPGYIAAHPGPDALPDPAVLWPDDGAAARQEAGWAGERPKRYLASFAAVGTIDQVLLGGLQVRHAALRSAAMLRLLLIVDEVHASDAYMTTILRNVLAQHRRAGGHALLMSATLGSAARVALLRPETRDREPALKDAVAADYPAVWTDTEPALALKASAVAAPQKRVEVMLEPDWSDGGAVVAHATAAARAGARVLVIRNTVRQVIATQQALEAAAPDLLLRVDGPAGPVCVPHHARYAPEDRLLLDAALAAALGKGASRTRGSIACCSQTAEQSLDIDADLLIADLCPADVLLQRIGRLHRHPRARPAGFERARCIVLTPSKAELAASVDERGTVRRAPLGLGVVYPNLVGVLATREALAASTSIEIPHDNRRLVEAATHPAALAAVAEQAGQVWLSQWQHYGGTRGAQVQEAAGVCLDWSKPIAPLKPVDIATRLGLRDRVVALPQGTQGPLGQPITRLTIREDWAAGIPLETEPVVVRVMPGVLEIGLGERLFTYDRLGLHAARAVPATSL